MRSTSRPAPRFGVTRNRAPTVPQTVELAIGSGHLLVSGWTGVRAFDLSATPATVQDDVGETNEDTTTEIHVLFNDTLPSDWSIVDIADPANGTANLSVIASPPTIQYTPDADFFGIDTFTYTVSDGTETLTRQRHGDRPAGQ